MWIVALISAFNVVNGSISNRRPFEVPSQRTVWTSADDGQVQFGLDDSEQKFEELALKYAILFESSDVISTRPTAITDNYRLYEKDVEKSELSLWESFSTKEKYQLMLGSIIILLGIYIFAFV
jgi:hypothetical protein